MSATGFRRIGLAGYTRGTAISIPMRGNVTGGGEYGAAIDDHARVFAITREPVAHRIVFTVAYDIFDKWFDLKLKEGKEEENLEFDQMVQEWLSDLNVKVEITRQAVYERAFGWSILALGYRDHAEALQDPLEQPVDIEDLKAYGPLQISNVKEYRDPESRKFGMPQIYSVTRSGLARVFKIHESRCLHQAIRLLKSDWKGISALDDVWDDLVTLRNIRWGMGQTMYRYGSGFPDLTFKGVEKDKIQDWINEGYFEDFSARKYFAHTDKQSLEFKGLAGRALDPMNYYLPPMEHISAGTGIPLAILRGVQAGALTGSQVNEREYYGIIANQQAAYEPILRALIDQLLILKGAEREIPDYVIDWKSGFELTEEQKANIEQTRIRTLLDQGEFMTVNEIRKLHDPTLPDLPAGVGDQLLAHVRSHSGSMGESYLVTPQTTRSPRSSPGS